jgi:hypothetical protein
MYVRPTAQLTIIQFNNVRPTAELTIINRSLSAECQSALDMAQLNVEPVTLFMLSIKVITQNLLHTDIQHYQHGSDGLQIPLKQEHPVLH